MAATDDFAEFTTGLGDPANNIIDADAVASDTVDLTHVSRFVLVDTTAGNATVITNGGQTVTLALAKDVIYPIRISRLKSTSLTAVGVMVLY